MYDRNYTFKNENEKRVHNITDSDYKRDLFTLFPNVESMYNNAEN